MRGNSENDSVQKFKKSSVYQHLQHVISCSFKLHKTQCIKMTCCGSTGLQEVTAPGQGIFPHMTLYKTTTCLFYSAIFAMIKPTRYNMSASMRFRGVSRLILLPLDRTRLAASPVSRLHVMLIAGDSFIFTVQTWEWCKKAKSIFSKMQLIISFKSFCNLPIISNIYNIYWFPLISASMSQEAGS